MKTRQDPVRSERCTLPPFQWKVPSPDLGGLGYFVLLPDPPLGTDDSDLMGLLLFFLGAQEGRFIEVEEVPLGLLLSGFLLVLGFL